MRNERMVVKEGEHSNSGWKRVGSHSGGGDSLWESFCLATDILKKDKLQHKSRDIRFAKVSTQQW